METRGTLRAPGDSIDLEWKQDLITATDFADKTQSFAKLKRNIIHTILTEAFHATMQNQC